MKNITENETVLDNATINGSAIISGTFDLVIWNDRWNRDEADVIIALDITRRNV